jgi:prepilin-type N-terminal cleavage/methylation domain-containing protein
MNAHLGIPSHHGLARRGFTFVEALMTIAILGIMAAVLVSAFSSASTDASRMIARQQQAAVQAAVNAWVNGEGNRVVVINATAGTGKMRTIEEIRTIYNNTATSLDRLKLVGGYLDTTTLDHLTDTDYSTNAGRIKSEALAVTKQYLSMPDWVPNGYPEVRLTKE